MTKYLIIIFLICSFNAHAQVQQASISKGDKTKSLDLNRIKSIVLNDIYSFDGEMLELNDSIFKFHSKYTLNRGTVNVDTIYQYRTSQLTQVFYCTKKDLSKFKFKRKLDPMRGAITLSALVTWVVGLRVFDPSNPSTASLSIGSGIAIIINELIWHKVNGLKKYKMKKWKFN
jgi:hypothetical protein